MYECFHCGHRAVIWDADFNFEDYGNEGEGIVQVLHCENCGVETEYRINCGRNECEIIDFEKNGENDEAKTRC